MKNRKRTGWTWGVAALAPAFFLAAYVLPGLAARGEGSGPLKHASGHCTKSIEVPVDHGQHNERPWSITAGVENNHNCRAWLLNMEFLPQDETPGSWKGSWAIPAGGHLSNSATIAARDETTDVGRVVSGVVGWRVEKVIFRTRSGHTFVVRPKVPRAHLRQRFVWLRNLRYFLWFYPVGDPVRVARLLNAQGETVATVRARLGEFLGTMGVF